MKRPYVICHILSSLDGKINGPFMETESVSMLGAEYGKFRAKMAADAWLYGTATTKEFINFHKPVLEERVKGKSENQLCAPVALSVPRHAACSMCASGTCAHFSDSVCVEADMGHKCEVPESDFIADN